LYDLITTDHLPVSMIINVDNLPDHSSLTGEGANMVKVDWDKLNKTKWLDINMQCALLESMRKP